MQQAVEKLLRFRKGHLRFFLFDVLLIFSKCLFLSMCGNITPSFCYYIIFLLLHHLFVITSSFSGSTVHSRWLHWDRVWCWVLYCSHSGWWMFRSKLCLRFFLFPKRSILHMMVHTFASMYHLTGNYAILSITSNFVLSFPRSHLFNNSPYKWTNGCEYMEIIYFNCS